MLIFPVNEKIKAVLVDRKTLLLAGALFLCIFSYLPFSFNNTLENANLDFLLKMRGARPPSSDVLFVYISSEDIQSLGGWPLTRDYYSYLIYALLQRGAKVIGMDFLFDSRERLYPEFDAILAEYIKSADNVCLPMAFSTLSEDGSVGVQKTQFNGHLLSGQHPVFPDSLFKVSLAGMGFSNLADETIIRRAPIVVNTSDSVMLSFGAEMARVYLHARAEISAGKLIFTDRELKKLIIPLDKKGQLLLNQCGSLEQFNAISMLHLLQTFKRSPDSLNIAGKMVIVGITSPGMPVIKSTPLASFLPGALIHATVAENIIHKNYLHRIPWFFCCLILIVFTALPYFLFQRTRKMTNWVFFFVIEGSFIVLALVVLSNLYLVIPVIYPLIGYQLGLIFLLSTRQIDLKIKAHKEKLSLHQQIKTAAAALQDAKAQLQEQEVKLLSEHVQKKVLSEQTEQLLVEKKDLVTRLEEHLRDLQPFQGESFSAHAELNIVHTPGGVMSQLIDLVKKIGSDDIPVFLVGETGTGKEIVALAIHLLSQRRNAPFVAVNCSALTETLLESELFGHEKGSFTGAIARRRGHFEMAHGGTLFLDEITETSQAFQAKLLRVLQEGVFQRIGGEQNIRVDVRVIAATNKEPKAKVTDHSFRADLYYRLNGITILLPPMRDRKEDIPLLAAHFLKKYKYQHIVGFSERAMMTLQNNPWPGNVRELENAVRHAAVMAQSEHRTIIQMKDLPKEMDQPENLAEMVDMYKTLEDQILHMLRALNFSHSAVSQTAKALGNRDRGTITEYFRGLCFEFLIKNNFTIAAAARELAGSDSTHIIDRVTSKINEYIANLQSWKSDAGETDISVILPPFKGLPKKYHSALIEVIKNLDKF